MAVGVMIPQPRFRGTLEWITKHKAIVLIIIKNGKITDWNKLAWQPSLLQYGDYEQGAGQRLIGLTERVSILCCWLFVLQKPNYRHATELNVDVTFHDDVMTWTHLPRDMWNVCPCHDVITLRALCEGVPCVMGDFLRKVEFVLFFIVCMNKLLNN